MTRYLIAFALVLVVWTLTLAPVVYAQAATPVPMCTAQNVLGFAYAGLVCGGSVIDNCTPGAL